MKVVIKEMLAALIAVMFTVAVIGILFLAFVDAYEQEVTGKCDDCTVLKAWFERNE